MMLHARWRRAAAALAMAALLAPAPVRAADDAPSAGAVAPDSAYGALMAMACGAGIRASQLSPQPALVVLTVICCAMMIVDAAATRDA